MENGLPDFPLLGQLMGRVLTHQPGLLVQQVGVDSLLGRKALVRPCGEAQPAGQSQPVPGLGDAVTGPVEWAQASVCFYSPGDSHVQSGWKTTPLGT